MAKVRLLTKGEFLPWVWGQGEPQEGHGGDQNTGDYQVEEVVEGASPDVDCEGDVNIGLRAAVIGDAVLLARHTWTNPCNMQ